MSKFVVSIRTDNSAFDGDHGAEVARILRALADRIEGAALDEYFPLRDINGNNVGEAGLK